MHYKEVIGQQQVKQRLRQQVLTGHIPHAQLFCGPEGSGKLPMALAFATALLCESPVEGEACGSCKSCKMAAALQHPDLHFVFPVIKRKGQSGEPTSNQYLAEWNAQLADTPYFDRSTWLERMKVENQQSLIYAAESDSMQHKLSLVSSQGGHKVMIVWQPEQMNLSAANKVLKLLEEPPSQTVFILVSQYPERLLETILSRVQTIEFRPLSNEEIMRALVEQGRLQNADAEKVAQAAAGSYIAALRQLTADSEDALFFDMFVLLMRLSYMRKIKDMSEWADQVASWGRERQKHFLEYCQRLVRENFVYNFRRPELVHMNEREADFAVKFARFINERNIVGIMEELSAAQRDVEQNVNPRMIFFDFALKMIVLLIQ